MDAAVVFPYRMCDCRSYRRVKASETGQFRSLES